MTLSRKISIGFLLALAGLIVFFAVRKYTRAIEVKTERASRGVLEITVTATATGTVKPDTEVKISAERTGRIERLLINEGDVVRAGQTIIEMDTSDARLSLDMSGAAYERAGASLSAARAMYEPLRADVEANAAKTGATLREAGRRLERYKGLREKGFISEMELDSATRDYDLAVAAHEAARSGEKQLLGRAEEIKALEAALREARNSMLLAKLNYGYSFVNSPISGVVSARPVKLGETVMKGAHLASVTAMSSLYVESFIDEADIGKVRLGQQVRVTMDAYPGRIYNGSVYMISPVVLGGRHETRTFEVRTRVSVADAPLKGADASLKGADASLKGADAPLKPGMSADVEIIADKVQGALIVPSQAVVEREGSRYVWLISGGRAVLKKVETGLSNWSYTEITSGISEGDEVIANPDAPGLKEGVRVKAGGKDNRA